MNIRTVGNDLDTYFNKIRELIKAQTAEVTYDRGYYWSTAPELNRFEDSFIEYAHRHKEKLFDVLNNNTQHTCIALHLIGWAKPIGSGFPTLKSYLLHKNQKLRNAAARSMFPLIASGRKKIDTETITPLLYKRSTYDQNKALGLLLYAPNQDIPKNLVPRIVKLSESNELMVRIPALRLLEKYG